MAREVQQHITIVNRDGATTEFAGDDYRLITGPMGMRFVLDENSQQVWVDPPVQRGGGPATVSVSNARPDYAPILTADQAMGLAAPNVPPPLLHD